MAFAFKEKLKMLKVYILQALDKESFGWLDYSIKIQVGDIGLLEAFFIRTGVFLENI